MSADEIDKGDDPLETPRAGTRTRGSAPMEPDQDRAPEHDLASEQDQTPEDETKRPPCSNRRRRRARRQWVCRPGVWPLIG